MLKQPLTRRFIAQAVLAYFARGGKITKCPARRYSGPIARDLQKRCAPSPALRRYFAESLARESLHE